MNMIKGKLERLLYAGLILMLTGCMLFTGCAPATSLPDNSDATLNEDGAENGGETDGFKTSDSDAGNNEEIDENQGFESGFDLSCEIRPQVRLAYSAYKSDKSIFDIDNVTLEFFFGDDYNFGIEYALNGSGGGFAYFWAYFVNNEGDEIVIKHYDENFISEKYTCEVMRDERYNDLNAEYNYSELFTIPKELFTRESGAIWFKIKGRHIQMPYDYGLTGIAVYYKKINDDQVMLSNRPFE